MRRTIPIMVLLLSLFSCGDSEVANKPTERVDWAEDAPAGRVADEADTNAFRAEGYPVRYTPPSPVLNRQWNNTGLWIQYLDTIGDAHASLQDLIEESNVSRGAPFPSDVIHARYLNQDLGIPGEQADSVSLGDLGAGPFVVAASGRFVAARTGADEVTVYNERDLTVYATVTTQAAPATQINAIALDPFSLAISYDNVIELYDLSDDTAPLDTDWATAGVYNHDAPVNAMELSARALLIGADPSGGAGDSTAGHNLVILEADGSPFGSLAIPTSDILKLDYWQGRFALLLQDTGTSDYAVSVLAPDLTEQFRLDMGHWWAVHDIAINASHLCVAGTRNAGSKADSPTVEFYTLQPGAGAGNAAPVSMDRGFDTTADWTFETHAGPETFIIIARSSGAGVDSKIIEYDPVAGAPPVNASANVQIIGGSTTVQFGYGFEPTGTSSGTGIGVVTLDPQPPAHFASIDVRCQATLAGSVGGFVMATYAGAGDINLKIYRGTDNAQIDGTFSLSVSWDVFGALRLWEASYSSDIPASAFDLNHVYIVDEDYGGAGAEMLRKLTLARGPGFWRAADRSNDAVTHGAFPLE